LARTKQRQFAWDWYSVSVDAVRLLLGTAVVAVVLLVAYFGYGRYNQVRLQQKASEWVAKPETLLRQLRSEQGGNAYRADLAVAESRLDEARQAYDSGSWRPAIAHGRASFDLLQGVLDQARLGGSIAWFLSVQGDVQYRRGESGPFLRAYPRTELHETDYVRSGKSSSAEIHFRNEDTVFRLRPGSLIKLSRPSYEGDAGDRTLGFMEYGWVALDTAGTPSSLQTPYAHLRAQEHSLVSIELVEGSRRTQIRVSEGSAQVRDLGSGERSNLGERQQVEQTSTGFSTPIELPPHPLLAAPPDGFTLNIDNTDRLRLQWTAVPGASRYSLQVSKNRLFGDNVIDASYRSGTEAQLLLRAEGNYVWRVAAYDSRGALGPWSEARKFRVASYRDLALEVDREPPTIEVEILVNGSIALIVGTTEPGATLAINQENTTVAADGSFTATRTLWGVGRLPVDFLAVDRAGNQTTERHWVFVDEG
jgi:hypothetical protein